MMAKKRDGLCVNVFGRVRSLSCLTNYMEPQKEFYWCAYTVVDCTFLLETGKGEREREKTGSHLHVAFSFSCVLFVLARLNENKRPDSSESLLILTYHGAKR